MTLLTNPLRAWWFWASAALIPFLVIWVDQPLALYMKSSPPWFQDIFQLITLAGEAHYTLVPAGVLGLGFAWWAKRTDNDAVRRARFTLAQAAGFVFACVAAGGIARAR